MAVSWCDLNLNFDLAIVILTLKILFVLYFVNCNLEVVGTCQLVYGWAGIANTRS